MNFEELKHQILNPQAGDTIFLEFADTVCVETDIVDVHGNNILVYTDEIAGKLINTLEAKYQGKTVKLGKPIRTGTDEPGKFKVYVKDPKTGNVKMVRFGHQGGGANKDKKTMRIKKSNPARRKSFRARHNCANPGPRTKARYWSCRMW